MFTFRVEPSQHFKRFSHATCQLISEMILTPIFKNPLDGFIKKFDLISKLIFYYKTFYTITNTLRLSIYTSMNTSIHFKS